MLLIRRVVRNFVQYWVIISCIEKIQSYVQTPSILPCINHPNINPSNPHEYHFPSLLFTLLKFYATSPCLALENFLNFFPNFAGARPLSDDQRNPFRLVDVASNALTPFVAANDVLGFRAVGFSCDGFPEGGGRGGSSLSFRDVAFDVVLALPIVALSLPIFGGRGEGGDIARAFGSGEERPVWRSERSDLFRGASSERAGGGCMTYGSSWRAVSFSFLELLRRGALCT
jgi:hypothetical protein